MALQSLAGTRAPYIQSHSLPSSANRLVSASLGPSQCSLTPGAASLSRLRTQHQVQHLKSTAPPVRRRLATVRSQAEGPGRSNSEEDQTPTESTQQELPQTSDTPKPPPSLAQPPTQSLSLDDVNPVGLGRRSRQFLDDVWRRLLELGQPARPALDEEDEGSIDLIQGPNCEFAIPNAEDTRVLVVGATGRVGRVLVRKLLLRGYSVRVLVRKADVKTMEQLPGAVEVMEADLENDVTQTVLTSAVQGCQKVIYCATATSPLPEKLAAVDERGVVRLAKALLDHNHHLAQRRAGRSRKSKAVVVKFNKDKYQQGWKLREGKTTSFSTRSANGAPVPELGADAEFEITPQGHGLFQGSVVERGAYVEVKRVLEMPEGLTLGRFEGLVLRVSGDGKPYSLVLECENKKGHAGSAANGATSASSPSQSDPATWDSTADWAMMEDDDDLAKESSRNVVKAAESLAGISGHQGAYQYVARFSTRRGASTVRIPFSAFRPSEGGMPSLDPSDVTSLAIRFEQRRPKARPPSLGGEAMVPVSDPFSFKLELDFIKAFPGGDETDYILVSCTGAALPEDAREAVMKAKMSAENQLRNSGLGYTIVRPGPLFEEPGGRRALVFDQGNRISQGISCADVADVCVKALHDPLARNKSFDICYEYTDGTSLYELVAHLPDKANNYLTPALALLEKNT